VYLINTTTEMMEGGGENKIDLPFYCRPFLTSPTACQTVKEEIKNMLFTATPETHIYDNNYNNPIIHSTLWSSSHSVSFAEMHYNRRLFQSYISYTCILNAKKQNILLHHLLRERF